MINILHAEPHYEARRWQSCNWVNQDNKHFIHHRTFFPYSPFKPIRNEYWLDFNYTDLDLAKEEAKKYGFKATLHFYCSPENPIWFANFDDLDKAITFLTIKTGETFKFLE